VKIRDLLDVQAICEAGSFRKAALALGITQPTLSTRIAHLEDQLGASLFDRSRGQSRPTALAEFIATRAAGLANDASLLSRELERLASGQTGLVRLGLGPALLRVLVVPLATRIGAQHPDVDLEVHSGASAALRDRLLRREIDMVLASPLEPADPAIEAELLLETESVILAHPDHPMFEGPPPDIRELFQYPAALPFMEPRYADFLRTHFGVDFETQHGRLVCSDIDALAQVATGSSHFFTAGPRFAFAKEISSGRLRVLKTTVPTKHLILLQTNRNAYPLPAVQVVRKLVRQVFMEFVASIP
jgi:DNA-binding transcriptional LysR family regulator